MWAVAAQPRTGLTPMMPTPSVDSGIARAGLISKLLLRAVDETAPYEGSPSRERSAASRRPVAGVCAPADPVTACGPGHSRPRGSGTDRLASCKKRMDATVITLDVVSSIFASRECGLFLGDAREVLRTLAEDSVDCTVTSPPYYSGRRHVGDSVHEIGSEKNVEEYVEALVSVGRALYRVTRPTGSYWLNLDDMCERKEWLGISWRVAFAMRELGWKIRREVIWHTPEHVPNAANDRVTPAHEQLFHLVKRKDPS